MTLEDSASIAQLIIAVIAVLAFGSAVYGILDQRSIARKRAALDLFVRTELDTAMVETYNKYNKAVESLRDDTDIEEFSKTEEYRLVRSALNIHELVAVGIRDKVLDGEVCFDFWSDELMDAYRNCKRVIDHARLPPKGTHFTYADLERLNDRWVRRHRKLLRQAQ